MNEKRRRVRFDGIVHFPENFLVAHDALGAAVNAKIADISIKFTLPVEGHPGIGAGLIPPPNEQGIELSPLFGTFRNEWGIRSSKDEYTIGAARASFLIAPSAPGQTIPEELGRLGRLFGPWFDVFYNWSCAWSNVSPQRYGPIQQSAFHVLAPKNDMVGSGIYVNVVMQGDAHPLSSAQIRSAFSKASKEIYLPSEHKLILLARAGLADRDYRQAVIDAGTAAEVALATAVSNELHSRNLGHTYIENTILHADGLAGLVSIYTWLGFTSPISRNKISDQLARIRNKAAHAAYVPTMDEAARAVQLARDLVNSASPLSLI